jgi:hypothetical protein
MKFKPDHFPVAEERGDHRRIGTDGCSSARLRPFVAMALSHSRSQLQLSLRDGYNVKITTA